MNRSEYQNLTQEDSVPLVALPDNLCAHSVPYSHSDEWQRLDSHLNNVSNIAGGFAETFESGVWAWNAGMLHDIGKASDGFQAYLRRANHLDDSEYDRTGGRGNHSSAGTALAEEVYHLYGRILAYLIAGHHAGLPDFEPCDGGNGALKIRLEDGRIELKKIPAVASTLSKVLQPLRTLPSFVNAKNFHFWLRMLFSCLVDADYLETESFMRPDKTSIRQGWASLRDLKSKLDLHMEIKTRESKVSIVNSIRAEVLNACREGAKNKPGLFSLTVPTGGGKTLSAMSFALDHADLRGKKRIIYVIPYTSIIEQTSKVLSEIFGPEQVIEHHSNIDPERGTLRSDLASENWDAPIIMTTNVQFFESLYAARPGRCRKLHNLVESVVIMDEAQMIPPTLLDPCVAAIDELTKNYGVTVLLSTATQPSLPNLEPIELVPRTLNLYERLKRTVIQFPDLMSKKLSWEEVASKLKDHDQVLCIVNSRRDCHDLFSLMPEGTVHLSALMCGKHRSSVIEFIKDQLKMGNPVRVISTQLVEAGVDIDFPVVYRALSGLDSIVQAAGRCNREGHPDRMGQVVVFNPPRSAPPGLLRKGEDKTRELISLPVFDPQDPKTFRHYFSLFYGSINDTGANILKQLTPSDPRLLDVPFRSVGDNFKLIDDRNQRPVFVRYDKGVDLIEELHNRGPNRELLRRLQRFTVNLQVATVEKMMRDGLLQEVWEGFFAQSGFSIYSEETGLDVFREGIPTEDLIGV